jgi:parallel beta-helix repeat protein
MSVITGSLFSGNQAAEYGGGLNSYYSGGLALGATTVSGNTADLQAGGVGLYDMTGPATIIDSTISGNSTAGGGGGVSAEGSALGVFNSTISGNTADANGGGIYFYGVDGLTVDMSTVTQNIAGASTGGIFLGQPLLQEETRGGAPGSANADEGAPARTPNVHAAQTPGELMMTGSIVWGNSGNDVGEFGTLLADHDLLGVVDAGVVITDQGGNLTGVDPMLGALASNGGPTQTHELLAGSPAIDAGPDPVPGFPGNEFDQRGDGYARVVAGTADIGAFEVQAPVPAVIQPRFTG